MAASVPFFPEASSAAHNDHQSKEIRSVKELVEYSDFNSNIPSNYIFISDTKHYGPGGLSLDPPEEIVPVIDFALLTSNDPDQRATTIQQLGKACQDWGVFLVTNHGVPDVLTKGMINFCQEFFDLPEEEKQILDGVRYVTGTKNCPDQVSFWRDYFKVILHPEFTSPIRPTGFSETTREISKRFRELARELLKGISRSLGLDENYIDNALNMEKCYQYQAANLYPPCPQPQLAIGLPPHTDPNLLTILIQNGIGGLQVKHKDKWIHVNFIPNSLVVIIADQLEILSNGKYKGVIHRATLNSIASRISTAMAIGPALDAVVRPAQNLAEGEDNVSIAYTAMKYKDYLEGIYNRTLTLDSLKITKIVTKM